MLNIILDVTFHYRGIIRCNKQHMTLVSIGLSQPGYDVCITCSQYSVGTSFGHICSFQSFEFPPELNSN